MSRPLHSYSPGESPAPPMVARLAEIDAAPDDYRIDPSMPNSKFMESVWPERIALLRKATGTTTAAAFKLVKDLSARRVGRDSYMQRMAECQPEDQLVIEKALVGAWIEKPKTARKAPVKKPAAKKTARKPATKKPAARAARKTPANKTTRAKTSARKPASRKSASK